MKRDSLSIVLDIGSSWIRAGFSGEDSPRCQFPTIVSHYPGADDKTVGEEALMRQGLKMNYPIEWGVVVRWDDMERILRHAVTGKLGMTLEEHSVLLTEPAGTPKRNREKLTELMFDELHCPAICIENQSVLALMAAGRLTGLVVDLGGGISQSVPIYEGYNLPRGICHRGLDGEMLTQVLRTLLMQSGHSRLQSRVLQEIKESLCYVALNFEQETVAPATFHLPDGRSIDIGKERCRCPEAFFQPTAVGLDGQGIHEKIIDSIMKVDTSIQRDLFANIVLSGGSSLFSGLPERLEKELNRLVPTNSIAKVVAPKERQLSTWIGGSILSSSAAFEQRWIHKEDFEEVGPTIVHQKCF